MGEKKVLVVNGANMDLLGKRDPGAFGADTLDILMGELVEYGKEMGVQVSLFQSNVEGEVINILHASMTG